MEKMKIKIQECKFTNQEWRIKIQESKIMNQNSGRNQESEIKYQGLDQE